MEKLRRLETLKKIREDNKYSFTDMAKKLGVTKPYYWQLENGKRRLRYDMACKIAKIFNMKSDKLFYNDFIDEQESIFQKEEHHYTMFQ